MSWLVDMVALLAYYLEFKLETRIRFSISSLNFRLRKIQKRFPTRKTDFKQNFKMQPIAQSIYSSYPICRQLQLFESLLHPKTGNRQPPSADVHPDHPDRVHILGVLLHRPVSHPGPYIAQFHNPANAVHDCYGCSGLSTTGGICESDR